MQGKRSSRAGEYTETPSSALVGILSVPSPQQTKYSANKLIERACRSKAR